MSDAEDTPTSATAEYPSQRPSIARVNEQYDPRFAASRHTTVQSATLGHHPAAHKPLLISRFTDGKP